jgi:SAM-dependent methyltransferase
MNYENLDFDGGIFDEVYTMETLVHAGDPNQTTSEFYRVLKPGGVLTHLEYEHELDTLLPSSVPFSRINSYARISAVLIRDHRGEAQEGWLPGRASRGPIPECSAAAETVVLSYRYSVSVHSVVRVGRKLS